MSETTDKTMSRIQALLRKAERTDNPHEAEAYLAKAQQLATQASIDLAKARAADGNASKITPEMRTVILGRPRQRGLQTLIALAANIAGPNDVLLDIASDDTRIYAFGFSQDLDVFTAMYTRLSIHMALECRRFLDSGIYKREKTTGRRRIANTGDPLYDYIDVVIPMPAITARLDFQRAYARRIGARLRQARRDAEQQAAHDDTVGQPGTALVLADKRKEVDTYRDGNSEATRAYKERRPSSVSQLGLVAGDSAAANAQLANHAEIDNTSTALESARP